MTQETIEKNDKDVVLKLARQKRLEQEVQLESPVWDDLRVPYTSFGRMGIKDPDFVKIVDDGSGSTGVFGYGFDDTAEEELFFAVQMPHGWVIGSDIKPHIHWLPLTTNAGTVRWGLELWQTVRGATPVASTSIISVGATAPGVANEHATAGFGAYGTASMGLSSMLLGRLFRDATGALGTDDFVGDAMLLELDFHIQLERWGSLQEFSG